MFLNTVHSERAIASVESGGPMQAAASETLPGHTAASHQISPHALRNDGLDGQNVNDKNNNIPQQKTTTALMSAAEKDEYEKRVNKNNSESEYITLQEAFDIAVENGKTDKTWKSLRQKNWLRIQMNRQKPLTANQRTLLKEAGLQLHPTDRNLVLPCHASMNDPVVVTKYRHAPVYPRWP